MKSSATKLGLQLLSIAIVVTCLIGCNDSPSVTKRPRVVDRIDSTSSAADGRSDTARHTIQWMSRDVLSPSFSYECGMSSHLYSILEVTGGGVCMIDYELDGRLDLAFAGGGAILSEKKLLGAASGLYRNLGNWKFQDCIRALGASPTFHTHGVSGGDFDNDGFTDLLISGYAGLQLLHNLGDGTFEDCTAETGLSEDQWAVSTAWIDLNQDGNLDLYVGNFTNWSFENDPVCIMAGGNREACGPARFDAIDDRIWMSSGDGSFTNESETRGIAKGGKGLAVLAADMDRDGDTDIYVANDNTPNFLYLNDGQGKLTETGVANGAALGTNSYETGSMGIALGDYNRDGTFDLCVTNFVNEYMEVYRNDGKAVFSLATHKLGLDQLGIFNSGWGNVWMDGDLDGDEDLMIVTGHVIRLSPIAPFRQLPIFCENIQGKRLQIISSKVGDYFQKPWSGRGLAAGDLDADGDLDAAVSHLDSPAILLENQSQRKGSFLNVQLIGTKHSRDAIGTVVEIECGGEKQFRQRVGNGSFASTHTPYLHFGLCDAKKVDRVRVYWPNQPPQEFVDVPTNSFITAIQP